MQAFVCPRCKQKGSFDPWVESAHCSACGYTPQPLEPDEGKGSLSVQPSAAGGRIPQDPVVRIYNATDREMPGFVILVKKGAFLYTFGHDAKTVARVCGGERVVDESFKGAEEPVAKIPLSEKDDDIALLAGAGYHVEIAGTEVQICPQCGFTTKKLDAQAPAIRCPACDYFPPELERYIQKLLDEGIAAARAGKPEAAHERLSQVIDHQGTPHQLAIAILWLAAITPNLYQKEEYLKKVLALAYTEDKAIVKTAQKKLAQVRSIIHGEENAATTATPSQPAQRFDCPQCGGMMKYAPAGNGLQCEHCGYQQPLHKSPLPGTTAEEQPFWMAMANLTGHGKPEKSPTFACTSCGATFLVTPQALSLTCPYCATPYVIKETTLQELIPPTGIIPFVVSLNKTENLLHAWLTSLGIAGTVEVISPTGIYFPTWVFDVTGVVAWTENTMFAPSPSSSGQRSIMRHDVVVPASRKLPEKLAEELEHFDLHQLVPYDARYLADWPAEMYSITLSNASIKAREKVIDQARSRIKQSGRGSRDLQVRTDGLSVDAFKLILLPIWIAHYTHGDRQYHVVTNGQRGTVRGEKPPVLSRIWK